AGAGWIGKYSECTFQLSGTGTFRPLVGTSPFIGKIGELERVSETRLETIVPESKVDVVVRAMLGSHPYEEVAYDLYPLKNPGKRFGFGRVGKLPQPMTLGSFAERVKESLGQKAVRVVGQLERMVSRVAVCGGSGAALLHQAIRSKADVYVTGDVRHHDALNALAQGIALIDAGHHGTERVIVSVIADYLKDKANEEGCALHVEVSEVNTDPFYIL
ncbi:MAG: YqfO family protein, partial [Thermacetogeniaceae bacterium]